MRGISTVGPDSGSWLGLPTPEPVRRGLLSERVALEIERLVVDQRLRPGDRLPPARELTDRFGVSRTVVRDAIAALEQRGLVETRPGSGVFVRDGGSEAVADVLGQMLRQKAISLPELMETRQLLEVHNAAHAARRAEAGDHEVLAQAIDSMVLATEAQRYVEADVAFHEALAKAAGNRVLAALLRSLRPLLLQGMLIGTVIRGSRERTIRDHRAILDAVAGRDERAARERMEAHLQRSYDEWAQAGYVKRGRATEELGREFAGRS
jgi:GntR family transcriptional repressor for pyruvate dehydrogenase complex